MSVKPTNKHKINIGRRQGDKNRSTSEVSLADMSDRLIEGYLDRYGVKPEILVTTRFNKNSDLSTAYLGKTNMIRDHKMVAEEKFPMSE